MQVVSKCVTAVVIVSISCFCGAKLFSEDKPATMSETWQNIHKDANALIHVKTSKSKGEITMVQNTQTQETKNAATSENSKWEKTKEFSEEAWEKTEKVSAETWNTAKEISEKLRDKTKEVFSSDK